MKSKTTKSKYFGEVLVSFVLWHPASRNSQQFQSVWMRRNWPLNEIGGKRHHERLPPGLNKKCHFMAAIYRATVLAFRLSADETKTDAMSGAVTHKWHLLPHALCFMGMRGHIGPQKTKTHKFGVATPSSYPVTPPTFQLNLLCAMSLQNCSSLLYCFDRDWVCVTFYVCVIVDVSWNPTCTFEVKRKTVQHAHFVCSDVLQRNLTSVELAQKKFYVSRPARNAGV